MIIVPSSRWATRPACATRRLQEETVPVAVIKWDTADLLAA